MDDLATKEGVALEYLRLNLAQESLQSSVQVLEPEELVEMDALDTAGRKLCGDFNTITDSTLSLEGITHLLEDRYTKGTLTQDTLAVSNVAMETYFERLGVRMVKPIAMEHFGLAQEGVVDIAEGIVMAPVHAAGFVADAAGSAYRGAKNVVGFVHDVSQSVYRFLKKKLVLVARHVVRVMGSIARGLRNLNARVKELESQLGKVSRKVPLVPYIKAESWCEYLCYSKRPFSKGLEGIGSEVTGLVDEHTKMSKLLIARHLDKLGELDNARDDPLDNFRVSPKEFLLPGMEQFHRSLRFQTPKGDNVFHRSHELPGGRAFYTQVNPTELVGTQAINSLEDVDFQVYYHDPKSYDTFKMKLAAAVAMPMSVFLTMVNPLLGAAAVTAAGTYIATRGQDNTGVERVVIDPSTVFECLSLKDAQRAIGELREGLAGLKDWEATVLSEPWKSQEIDELVLGICDREETTSNMKSYCNAVLNLMSNLSVGVHTYAFKVYNAMANFIEKSLKQYR